MPEVIRNVAAKGVSYFTPEQKPAPGTGLEGPNGGALPKLFTPLKIRGVELPNRVWVSPMCQYSAEDGVVTPWHLAHYGSLAMRGPGLIMIEATAVQARGRITPEDVGIWSDKHVEGLRKLVELVHSQNCKIAVQLAHAGRKASAVAPWLSGAAVAVEEVGGWPNDVIGPTNEPFTTDGSSCTPQAATADDIVQLKQDFAAAAKRAVAAGFDVIELHFAHGYLASTFLSPVTNTRTDQYGGPSFENRARLPLEIVEAVRAKDVLPETTPLFVRISAVDWLQAVPEFKDKPTWDVQSSIQLAKLFADRGVDVLDVSTGGINKEQKVHGGPAYQAVFAKQIKKELGDKLLVSTVGNIRTGTLAESVIQGGKDADDVPLDLVAAGRMFQKNPGLVWAWADDLDTSIQIAHQMGWGFKGRAATAFGSKADKHL